MCMVHDSEGLTHDTIRCVHIGMCACIKYDGLLFPIAGCPEGVQGAASDLDKDNNCQITITLTDRMNFCVILLSS